MGCRPVLASGHDPRLAVIDEISVHGCAIPTSVPMFMARRSDLIRRSQRSRCEGTCVTIEGAAVILFGEGALCHVTSDAGQWGIILIGSGRLTPEPAVLKRRAAWRKPAGTGPYVALAAERPQAIRQPSWHGWIPSGSR